MQPKEAQGGGFNVQLANITKTQDSLAQANQQMRDTIEKLQSAMINIDRQHQ